MRRPSRAALLGATACALLAGCTADPTRGAAPLPDPPPTEATTSSTAPPDYSRVELPGVRGRTTTTTLALGPGEASVNGTVTGPGGPVGNALVQVERLVGDAAVGTQLAAGADGTWSLPGVAGGRYRIRAWRPPDLAQIQPSLLFVGGREGAAVELKLERFAGPYPVATLTPDPPTVDQPANLVVQLTLRSVDAAGVVQAAPIAGARLDLGGGSSWAVLSSTAAISDATGRARWELRCRASGPQPITVVVGGAESFPLTLPACAEPPPVVVAPPSTTAPPAGATTTTRPASPATTRAPTTTTRPVTTTTRAVTTTTRPVTTTTRAVTTTTTRAVTTTTRRRG